MCRLFRSSQTARKTCRNDEHMLVDLLVSSSIVPQLVSESDDVGVRRVDVEFVYSGNGPPASLRMGAKRSTVSTPAWAR